MPVKALTAALDFCSIFKIVMWWLYWGNVCFDGSEREHVLYLNHRYTALCTLCAWERVQVSGPREQHKRKQSEVTMSVHTHVSVLQACPGGAALAGAVLWEMDLQHSSSNPLWRGASQLGVKSSCPVAFWMKPTLTGGGTELQWALWPYPTVFSETKLWTAMGTLFGNLTNPLY